MFVNRLFNVSKRNTKSLIIHRLYSSNNSHHTQNNGKHIFYKALKDNNVTDAFIYSGGSVMPLIDSLYKSDINYYVNSHEQNCGHAATGYAKISDKTGVCIVTSGPGITNMITPLLDAKNDSTPLIVFSGQVSQNVQGTNAFQEAPAIELTKHVTKWNYQIKDINEMYDVIKEGFRIANDGKKGSVHIDIPKCVSYQEFDSNYNNIEQTSHKLKSNNLHNHLILNQNNIKMITDLINKSQKPIIYLGQGCINSIGLLREFAISGNIPVTSTIHGTGIMDEHHKLSLRWCGMHGYAPANYALQEADLIIALGSRFDDRTTGNISEYAPEAYKAGKEGKGGIIHVNINNDEINFAVKSHYNFNLDCCIFLNTIIKNIRHNERKDWIKYINNLKCKYPFELKKSKHKLHMEHVIDTLYKKTLNKNVTFTTGVGNHQMQAYQFIKSQYPRKIISSGSLGVMGVGLPYAIGAQIADISRMIICLDGDSSFNMTLSDLKTIKEHNLPIKIAIMNNNAQMMVTIWERLFFEERYTATLNKHNPNYTLLADSFGIPSLSCSNPDNLETITDIFLNHKGPILCEFKVEQDICLPLVGPGNALDNMILPKSQTNNGNDNGKNTNISNKIKGLAPS